jgi:excisionase family DNA binding protein
MLQEFLNIRAMASYLDLKRSTLYTLVEEKKIPHYRIGRQIRFKLSEIEKWLEECKEPVVDAEVEARRVSGSLQKRSDARIKRTIRKIIEEMKGRGYTDGTGNQT